MPKVNKQDLLHVVQELWGTTGVLEDLAKRHLAEHLIYEAWTAGNREGITLALAGNPIKQALGDQWLPGKERAAAGLPSLRQLLGEDPYFVVKADGPSIGGGMPQPLVKLRISRLAKLIGHPELIEEYRSPGHVGTNSPAVGGGSNQAQQQQGEVALTEDGLPIRPGERPCPHYMKFGWCLFKQDCWYSHPPNAPSRKGVKPGGPGAGAPASANLGREPVLVESQLEPGVMLLNGVYPVRPGVKPCGYFVENGWCTFKAKCRLHHPPHRELAGPSDPYWGQQQQRAAAASPISEAGSSSAAGSPAVATGGDGGMVKQPPLQVLLGVVIDSVWPPRESKEAAVKGALARHIVDTHLDVVTAVLGDPEAEVTTLGSQAGMYLRRWWSQQQSLYDPGEQPYKSLANMLDDDPFFWASRDPSKPPAITLKLGQLITKGALSAGRTLSAMADAVWPPNAGPESWLRGTLAKWLLQAGFEGGGGEVLRQVLAVSPASPTVFRIDVAQAGEYLMRCWQQGPHPYDACVKPYAHLKPLISESAFLAVEPAPGRPQSQHVTLDLLQMLRQLPRIARAALGQGQAPAAPLNPAAAGPSRAPPPAAPAAGDDDEDAVEYLDVDDADEASSGGGDGGNTSFNNNSGSSAMPQAAGAPAGGGAARRDPAEEARADIAALQRLQYAAPPPGEGPRRMQRWCSRNKPEQAGFVWTEVAVRMLSPEGDDATMRVAEMVQHLEICPLLGVACSYYAGRAHLLQFFAPYASIGGVEMAAAVYLLDILSPSPAIRDFLALIAPVLSSRDNIKVCHSSKQWSGLLSKTYGIDLAHYYDTQQGNFVWRALCREAGRRPQLPDNELKRASDVSYSALLEAVGFYHPVRHSDSAKQAPRLWQNRPLTNELITCAAADVTYLIPLMEIQVRQVRQVAAEVAKQQANLRGGASRLASSLPPELALDSSGIASLAAGVEGQQRGGLSFAQLAEWASLSAFHQVGSMHGGPGP